MKLSESQILKIVQSPKNKSEVENGRKHESRLRLFTEPMFKEALMRDKSNTAYKEFTSFMDQAIARDKAIRIREFLLYPLTSIAMCQSVLKELFKVFDAGNSYFSVQTVKKNGGEQMQKALNRLSLKNWITEEGKKVLTNKPNTVIVLDKNEQGEPYFIPVYNHRIIDIDLKENLIDCEYVVFIHSKKENEQGEEEIRYSVYDEENYTVVLDKGGNVIIESMVPHGIGYCPARMFLDTPLNSMEEYNRKAPLSEVLGKISEWQYFDTYKFYADHHSPFATTEQVRSKCGHEDCHNGWKTHTEYYYEDESRKERVHSYKCKECESINSLQIGGKILLDPAEDDQESQAGKFKRHEADTGNLEYLASKLGSIETYISKKVVGVHDVVSKSAVNEKQMQGVFESKTNILLSLKTAFESVYTWCVKVLADSLNATIDLNVNFGTEYYLVSEDTLQKRYQTAKEAGMPISELNSIYEQIIENKYRTNPNKIERMKLINKLDPCPHETLDSKIIKFQNSIITQIELIISNRLINFVNRFEAENGSITEFSSNKPENQVKLIYEQFKRYANEERNSQAQQNGGIDGASSQI